MRTAKTINRRQIAQRARRDAEREAREPAPEYPPHGTPVGSITFELWGQTAQVKLLSTGKHARSFGVALPDGEVAGVMGPSEAWRLHVSPRVTRMKSKRNL